MYSEEARYKISLEGHLDERWAGWFGGMSIKNTLDLRGFPITTLSGIIVDQAALHNIITRIRDIGIPLISINRIASK